jgi:hypothetical protein
VFFCGTNVTFMRARFAVVLLLCALVCTRVQGSIVLSDVTRETGITFNHTDGSSGKRYIMETVSAGLALLDYDRDGDIDIYFLNGAPLKGTEVEAPPRNALYRNDGDFELTDVTEKAGVGDTGYGLGVAAGDYDNDGDLDLYLNNHGPNVLYRNNNDGTFTDVTQQAGVVNGSQVGAGACFLDIDKDGDLDLYAANYLAWTYEAHVPTAQSGFSVYANPRFYTPVPDTLFRNNGNGTFTDISASCGIGQHAGWGMGMVCADYDNDGDTDIFVANDIAENFLFNNDGTGHFEEVALMTAFAYDGHGDEQGSMGVDCGDINNDGLLDFYVTSYQGQLATLYRNVDADMFEDVTLLTGAGAHTLPDVTWGNGLVDFDNDGDRDIFVACGHLQDNIESYDDTTTYAARNKLLMNTGDDRFVDVSAEAGDGMAVALSSRGAGFDDLDNDGDIDVVILNSRGKVTVLRNDSPSQGHWLQVELCGVKTNRDGVGARVKVVSGDLTWVDEVHSGRGYQSHYGMRLHFGLGAADSIDRVTVSWIGGGTDVLERVSVDQVLIVTEGAQGAKSPAP